MSSSALEPPFGLITQRIVVAFVQIVYDTAHCVDETSGNVMLGRKYPSE